MVYGQTDEEGKAVIWYKDWSNPLIFRYSPSPLITGYGEKSDSLKAVHGSTFYELENEYVAIESWADYYYWFTKKYDVLFRQPASVYETYYFLNDLNGMIKFVFFNENYKGDYFPSAIRIQFDTKKQVRQIASEGGLVYGGTPVFDRFGMYRPDLVERRWLFKYNIGNDNNVDPSIPFILSGSRGSSSRSESSTSTSDN